MHRLCHAYFPSRNICEHGTAIPVLNNTSLYCRLIDMSIYQRSIRAFVWLLLRAMYRVRVIGGSSIPEQGGALLTPNHVSYIDAVLIAAHVKRPIRYAMYHRLYNRFRWIVEPMGAFPIAGKSENAHVYESAMTLIAQTLRDGGLVCLFPEGKITTTGLVDDFRPGVLRIVADTPVPVIPVGLCNLWGSYFSKKKPGIFKLPEHFMARVTMKVGEPIAPRDLTLTALRERILALTVG
jgi:1-acyl-sn-glycerol-3-phosphate acyltransferase